MCSIFWFQFSLVVSTVVRSLLSPGSQKRVLNFQFPLFWSKVAWLSCPRLQKVEGLPPKELRKLVDKGKKELSEGIVIVFASKDDKVGIAVGVTEKLIGKFDAVQFVKVGSEIIGGKGGGGRKDFAQAGGQDQSKIEEAFEKLKTLI